MKTVVKTTLKVWITPYSDINPSNLKPDMTARQVGSLSFNDPELDMTSHKYIDAGVAEVTVTFHDTDELILGRVESLKAQKTEIMATAQNAITRIEEEIQSLLALPDLTKENQNG